MFKSFKALRTVRTLFDQDGNLYRMAKRVIHKITTRFADGFKIFAKNKLFYTEALTTSLQPHMAVGAGIESVNQSQVTGLRSFSAYDIISTSGVSGKSLKFTQHGSSVDYPYATFDPDNSVGAAVFTKSLWNHNQLAYSNDLSAGVDAGYWAFGQARSVYSDDTFPLKEATPIEFTKGVPWNAPVALRTTGDQVLDSWDPDNKNFVFSYYFKLTYTQSGSPYNRIELRLSDKTNPQLHASLNLNFDETGPISGPNKLEDFGNGWYRASWYTDDTYNPNYTYGGDNLEIQFLWSGAENDRIVIAAPQLEQYPISKPSWSHNSLTALDAWVEGSGPQIPGWATAGQSGEAFREYRADPFGKQSILWVSKDTDIGGSLDGGFFNNWSDTVDIDSSASYRYSMWVRKRNDNSFYDSATLYMGLHNNDTSQPIYAVKDTLTDSLSTNPYFYVTGLNYMIPKKDEWYLVAGFVDAAGTRRGGPHPDQGRYDLDGNFFQGAAKTFEFSSTATETSIRSFFQIFDGEGGELEFWAPRIDKLDGNEPSIQDLLNPVDNPNYPPVTKATPYVGNDGIPANVHRHNWVNNSDDPDSWSYVRTEAITSSIQGSLFNGESCLRVRADGTGTPNINFGAIDATYDSSEDYICSIYVKKANDNIYMPQINSDMSAFDALTVGVGSDPGGDWNASFDPTDPETIREYGSTPFGGQDIVWVTKDTDEGSSGDGGAQLATPLSIDRTSDYRYTIFLKKNQDIPNAANARLGIGKQTTDPSYGLIDPTTGLPDQNPYAIFMNGSYSGWDVDEWYLLVSYVDAEGTSRGAYHPDAGVYRLDGSKLTAGNHMYVKSFEFDSTAIYGWIRWFHFANPAGNGDELEWWHPRIDKLDGNEPSIERLLSQAKAEVPAINYPEFDQLLEWTEGSGSITPSLGSPHWIRQGYDEENVREYATDPFGEQSVIWRAIDLENASNYDGGFETKPIACDNTQTYRYSVFAKQDSNLGQLFFGTSRNYSSDPDYQVVVATTGNLNTNPYAFAGGDLPTLNEWYLLVFHIQDSSTSLPGTILPDTGIWDMEGNKVADSQDFVFSSTTAYQFMRCNHYANPSASGAEIQFYQPRIDVVDGTEPSINELLRKHAGFRFGLLDSTNPAAAIAAVNITFNASGVPEHADHSAEFYVEEVGDGWYRVSDNLHYVGGNTIDGDTLVAVSYLQPVGTNYADLSAQQIAQPTYIMRPMIERVDADAPKSYPPTAYQRVSGGDWPSVSAIPYHKVQKTIELTLDDETSPTNTYRAKAWWDGGQLYHYGNLSGNQEVAIEHIEDGWFKFRNSVKGLLRDEGAVEGDIASMTFGFGDYSGVPYGKALFSAPILANTGSEKSGEVNYSVGTTVPGKNDVNNIIDWLNGGPGYIVSGTEVSSISVVNHTTPNGTSAILVHTDEAGANRDDLWFESATLNTRASNYDTVVAEVPVKSLWNYNVLPYTRNPLDDPGITYEGDSNGSYYVLDQVSYPVDPNEKGPDGVSQAITWTKTGDGNRTILVHGGVQTPESVLPTFDENTVVTFSIYLKRPDNVEDTVENFLVNFADNTSLVQPNGAYFSWGPDSEHPGPYLNDNHFNRSITFEDAGDGWYRVAFSVRGLGGNFNYLPKTENGDRMTFYLYGLDDIGKSIKYAQPQIEYHQITDTNLLTPAWDWFRHSPVNVFSNQTRITRPYGTPADNEIALREDPFGLSSLCWVGKDLDVDKNTEGGFNLDGIPVDASYDYRYSIFVRHEAFGDPGANIYFGPINRNAGADPHKALTDVGGSDAPNPYIKGAFTLPTNDWHLVVGHIQASSTSLPTSTRSDSRVYDMSGNVVNLSNGHPVDFVFSSTCTENGFRVFGYWNSAGSGDEVEFFSPRIEKVDGTEPTISELLASGNLWTNPNYQQTLPSPYVENVGVHPNPHRHNWLVGTEDLDNTAYWGRGRDLTLESSTVGTSYANGDACFKMINGSSPSQYGYIVQTTIQNDMFWDTDDEYIASVYVKKDTSSAIPITLGLRDQTDPIRQYELGFNFNGSSITSVSIPSQTTAYADAGYEELPDGWYRLWIHLYDEDPSTGFDGDNLAFWIYNGYAGSTYANEELFVMKPMLEIVPAGYTINNVPRSYQAVEGEWDLGVTSIPEHQCAEQLRLNLQELDVPGTANGASYNFSGGMLYAAPPQANTNTSVKYLGDGWYNAILSTSGTYLYRDEGDRFRLKIFPTEYVPDENRTSYGMFAQPFMGMTGDVNTSSVDYNP